VASIGGDRRITAFLDLIAASEGTSSSPVTKSDGYDIIVSGIEGHNRFDDFSAHPFAGGRQPILVRAARPAVQATRDPDTGAVILPSKPGVSAIRSAASGRYQLILETWNELATVLHLKLFSPSCQDSAAMELLFKHNADQLLLQGKCAEAIQTCNKVWASFPGNDYGQGGRTLDWLLTTYHTMLSGQEA
jgi:muramidase (phage lysozyme)